MVEVERGAKHHRQDRWRQSREYGVWLSYHTVCFSFPLILILYLEARRNLSARVNNTQIRRARCVGGWDTKGESPARSASIGTSIKIIKQINDHAWQTRGL